jgi:hypothetical protein
MVAGPTRSRKIGYTRKLAGIQRKHRGSIPLASTIFVLYGMSMQSVLCDWCGVKFSKPVKEINRGERLGRGNFCGLAHSAAYKNTLPESRARAAELAKLKVGSANPHWMGGVTLVESQIRSRQKHHWRWRARKAVENAVARGDMQRQTVCEDCQQSKFCEAHHEDYDHPLSVNWVCAKCHDARDAKMRQEGRL